MFVWVKKLKEKIDSYEVEDLKEMSRSTTSMSCFSCCGGFPRRRSRSEPRRVDSRARVAPECFRPIGVPERVYLEFVLNEKRQKFAPLHMMQDLDREDRRKVKPCKRCGVRYATVQCNPCNHGKICRFCAYDMLHRNVEMPTFPMRVVCVICMKLVTGFTKKRVGVKDDMLEKIRRRRQGLKDEKGDASVSFHDYAVALIMEKEAGKFNHGFEASNSF